MESDFLPRVSEPLPTAARRRRRKTKDRGVDAQRVFRSFPHPAVDSRKRQRKRETGMDGLHVASVKRINMVCELSLVPGQTRARARACACACATVDKGVYHTGPVKIMVVSHYDITCVRCRCVLYVRTRYWNRQSIPRRLNMSATFIRPFSRA
jgi:hypothetical protein